MSKSPCISGRFLTLNLELDRHPPILSSQQWSAWYFERHGLPTPNMGQRCQRAVVSINIVVHDLLPCPCTTVVLCAWLQNFKKSWALEYPPMAAFSKTVRPYAFPCSSASLIWRFRRRLGIAWPKTDSYGIAVIRRHMQRCAQQFIRQCVPASALSKALIYSFRAI